jgi:hypothetical protein
MNITNSGKVQKKHFKSAIIAIFCGLWLAAGLIVWNLSWGWIYQQVPSSKDIKQFIIIILVGYYLFQILPSIITKINRSIMDSNRLDLSNITKAKEKVS